MAIYSLAIVSLCFTLFHRAAAQCGREQIFDNCTARDNILRTSDGRPIGDKINSLTVGPRGAVLLQDIVYIDEIAHFDMERIPDRVVHAKGSGAFGYFEVTDDIRRFSKAKVFSQVGKRTPIAVRFSICNPDQGAADTVRSDFRGFSVKFYTEDGNWDILGLQLPVSLIRDALLFPSLVHKTKKNPANNLRDDNGFWDLVSLRPESTAGLVFLNSDRMIPLSYRYMDGYSVNTFKLINAGGEQFYFRYTLSTNQGIRNMPPERGDELAGTDPDNFAKDLYYSIVNRNYPSWTLNIQVMAVEAAGNVPFNPLDPTKEWPVEEFPLIRVGRLVLNRNPKNHFAEVEQLAFSVANVVPGIELSSDKLLQGRIFAYGDAQRYRLGNNYDQIPVNRPVVFPPRNYERDGFMTTTDNGGSSPNYYPNSYGGPVGNPSARTSPFEACGVIGRYDTSNEDNFTQARIYFLRMGEGERQRLAQNIVHTLKNAERFIQERQLGNFRQVHPELEQRVRMALTSN